MNPASTDLPLVLVVDDDDELLKVYSASLSTVGCEVLAVGSGFDALVAMRTRAPGVVVLDYMMPGMNGVDVLRHMRESLRTRETPVILLTASGDDDGLIQQVFALGAIDFVAKPVNLRVLSERIKRVVRSERWKQNAMTFAAGAGLHAKVDEALEQAEKLQQGLLPAADWRAGDWVVNGEVVASSGVGGDIYDAVETSRGTAIALIDVSGHGLAAGLFASNVRGMLRVLLQKLAFEDVLAELNRQLTQANLAYYACVAIVSIAPTEVLVSNAGLPPVTILSDRQLEAELSASGPPPGLVDGATYSTTRLPIENVRRVILVSDGLTEPFGPSHCTRRVLSALQLLGPGPLVISELKLERAIAELFAVKGGQDDDASIVVIERCPV